MSIPPPLSSRIALFLDFDGTLVDIAPTPETVRVPAGLVASLERVHDQLRGALAMVSGRQIDALDRFLTPLHLPCAGEHGVQRRDAQGALYEQAAPELSDILQAANALAMRHNGLLVERKHAAIALHYRLAPALETRCRAALQECIAHRPDLELMHGKQVFEVKPAGINKGAAIAAFLREAPFRGRQPVFAGDDTTDESGFATVQALGGIAIKVGAGPTQARHRLDSPEMLRQWLQG